MRTTTTKEGEVKCACGAFVLSVHMEHAHRTVTEHVTHFALLAQTRYLHVLKLSVRGGLYKPVVA